MILLALLGCVPGLPDVDEPCEPWDEPGLYQIKVEMPDGPKRRAYVWVPTAAGPRDMVVALHGGASSPTDLADVSQYMRVAENEGFVAVFPQGRGDLVNLWNGGSCCGSSQDDRRDVDDVAFLERLVRELSPKVCGRRVLGTGFSNGGMLAHRWACEGSRVDAVVPVSGPLAIPEARCEGPPVPIRHYHGTADSRVPYDGGSGDGYSSTEHRSVEETMATWRRRNLCADTAPQTRVDGDTVCQAWSCQAATELCSVEGWGHAWPGGRNSDRTSADATRDGWEWFQGLVPPTTDDSPPVDSGRD